jgi:preprotein translocase subunit SecA
MRRETVAEIVEAHCPPGTYPEQWDVDGFETAVRETLMLDLPVRDWMGEEAVDQELFVDRLNDALDARMAEKAEAVPAETWASIEKNFLLQSIDHHWKEHLATLDALRQVIHLRAYAQKQPINEYKAEAFALFERMLRQVREDVTRLLSGATIRMPEAMPMPDLPDFLSLDGPRDPMVPSFGGLGGARGDLASAAAPGVFALGDALSPDELEAARAVAEQFGPSFDPHDPETWQRIVPRNAACPCGSGRKFKHCHGTL